MDAIRFQNFINNCIEKGIAFAFAESVTCGMAASCIADLKGVSLVLKGSLVAYDENVKKTLLKVPAAIIETCTAESQECTTEMVKGMPALFDAQLYAAITGLASKGGTETPGKPVGSIFLAIMYKGVIHNFQDIFKGSSLEVREQASEFIFEKMELIINREHSGLTR